MVYATARLAELYREADSQGHAALKKGETRGAPLPDGRVAVAKAAGMDARKLRRWGRCSCSTLCPSG